MRKEKAKINLNNSSNNNTTGSQTGNLNRNIELKTKECKNDLSELLRNKRLLDSSSIPSNINFNINVNLNSTVAKSGGNTKILKPSFQEILSQPCCQDETHTTKLSRVRKPNTKVSSSNNNVNLSLNNASKTNNNNSETTIVNTNTTKAAKTRVTWSSEEDNLLTFLVKEWSKNKEKINWTEIADKMKIFYSEGRIPVVRSGKQCRERWFNHLEIDVNKKNWTPVEEAILFEKAKVFGNKWSEIAKFLDKRTDNCIKNHYYSNLRKKIRKLLKTLGGKLEVEISYGQAPETNLKPADFKNINPELVYKIIKQQNITYLDLDEKKVAEIVKFSILNKLNMSNIDELGNYLDNEEINMSNYNQCTNSNNNNNNNNNNFISNFNNINNNINEYNNKFMNTGFIHCNKGNFNIFNSIANNNASYTGLVNLTSRFDQNRFICNNNNNNDNTTNTNNNQNPNLLNSSFTDDDMKMERKENEKIKKNNIIVLNNKTLTSSDLSVVNDAKMFSLNNLPSTTKAYYPESKSMSLRTFNIDSNFTNTITNPLTNSNPSFINYNLNSSKEGTATQGIMSSTDGEFKKDKLNTKGNSTIEESNKKKLTDRKEANNNNNSKSELATEKNPSSEVKKVKKSGIPFFATVLDNSNSQSQPRYVLANKEILNPSNIQFNNINNNFSNKINNNFVGNNNANLIQGQNPSFLNPTFISNSNIPIIPLSNNITSNPPIQLIHNIGLPNLNNNSFTAPELYLVDDHSNFNNTNKKKKNSTGSFNINIINQGDQPNPFGLFNTTGNFSLFNTNNNNNIINSSNIINNNNIYNTAGSYLNNTANILQSINNTDNFIFKQGQSSVVNTSMEYNLAEESELLEKKMNTQTSILNTTNNNKSKGVDSGKDIANITLTSVGQQPSQQLSLNKKSQSSNSNSNNQAIGKQESSINMTNTPSQQTIGNITMNENLLRSKNILQSMKAGCKSSSNRRDSNSLTFSHKQSQRSVDYEHLLITKCKDNEKSIANNTNSNNIVILTNNTNSTSNNIKVIRDTNDESTGVELHKSNRAYSLGNEEKDKKDTKDPIDSKAEGSLHNEIKEKDQNMHNIVFYSSFNIGNTSNLNSQVAPTNCSNNKESILVNATSPKDASNSRPTNIFNFVNETMNTTVKYQNYLDKQRFFNSLVSNNIQDQSNNIQQNMANSILGNELLWKQNSLSLQEKDVLVSREGWNNLLKRSSIDSMLAAKLLSGLTPSQNQNSNANNKDSNIANILNIDPNMFNESSNLITKQHNPFQTTNPNESSRVPLDEKENPNEKDSNPKLEKEELKSASNKTEKFSKERENTINLKGSKVFTEVFTNSGANTIGRNSSMLVNMNSHISNCAGISNFFSNNNFTKPTKSLVELFDDFCEAHSQVNSMDTEVIKKNLPYINVPIKDMFNVIHEYPEINQEVENKSKKKSPKNNYKNSTATNTMKQEGCQVSSFPQNQKAKINYFSPYSFMPGSLNMSNSNSNNNNNNNNNIVNTLNNKHGSTTNSFLLLNNNSNNINNNNNSSIQQNYNSQTPSFHYNFLNLNQIFQYPQQHHCIPILASNNNNNSSNNSNNNNNISTINQLNLTKNSKSNITSSHHESCSNSNIQSSLPLIHSNSNNSNIINANAALTFFKMISSNSTISNNNINNNINYTNNNNNMDYILHNNFLTGNKPVFFDFELPKTPDCLINNSNNTNNNFSNTPLSQLLFNSSIPSQNQANRPLTNSSFTHTETNQSHQTGSNNSKCNNSFNKIISNIRGEASKTFLSNSQSKSKDEQEKHFNTEFTVNQRGGNNNEQIVKKESSNSEKTKRQESYKSRGRESDFTPVKHSLNLAKKDSKDSKDSKFSDQKKDLKPEENASDQDSSKKSKKLDNNNNNNNNNVNDDDNNNSIKKC